MECHEIWEYDDVNHIQKLIGLISLCPNCHLVKHIGRAIAMGNEKIPLNQLAKVNKWTTLQVEQHVIESFKLHKQRSKFKWTLDLSLLENEPYNIKLKNTKDRIFEIKKFKKKKSKIKKIHPKQKLNNFLKPKTSPNRRPPKIQ